MVGMPLLCVIVGCHCSVLWLGGKVTTKFGGVDVMPLLGAIAAYQFFRATTFIQTPKKTAMNFVLSFLQTLHSSLYSQHKNWFLLSGVYTGKISNRGEGDEPLWRIGRGTQRTIAGSSGCGAIAGCHPRVPL